MTRKERVEEMVRALVAGHAYVHLVNLSTPQSLVRSAEELVDAIDAAYPAAKPGPMREPGMDTEPELKPGYGDYR